MPVVRERLGRWDSPDLVTALRGAHDFASWTQSASNSAKFYTLTPPDLSPAFYVVGFDNNNGTGIAIRRCPWARADLALPASGTFEDIHTVHLRVTQNNRKSGMHWALGPATAIHAGAGPGNWYCALMRNVAGSPTVRICKVAGGVLSELIAFSNVPVDYGDSLELSYYWDTAITAAVLSLQINGILIGATTDVGGYRMSTVADGRVGIYGHDADAIPSTADFGHWFTEWWVSGATASQTNVRQTFPDLTGALKVQMMQKKRYVGDAKPQALWILGKALEHVEFSYARQGGHRSATIRWLPEPWTEGTTAHPLESGALHPLAADWRAEDWHGGDVRILCRYTGQRIAVGGSTAGYTSEDLWRGRIREIAVDPQTRAITIRAEGYAASLSERRVTYVQKNVSIRDALNAVIQPALKGASWPYDGPIEDINLIGLGTMLDQTIDVEFRDNTVREALDRLMALLPDTMLWGVQQVASADGQGTVQFYVQPMVDAYAHDLASGPAFPSYDAARARGFARRLRLNRIVNHALVFGRQLDPGVTGGGVNPEVPRVGALAFCRRSASLWRTRVAVTTEDAIADEGLAAKLAAAIAKRRCSPRYSMTLSVAEIIDGTHSFWHLLVPFSPWLAIRLREHPLDAYALRSKGGPPSLGDDHQIADAAVRRYGDVTGVSLKLNGTAGGEITFASEHQERSLNRSWLAHLVIRFDVNHPGAIGDIAFICGRRQTTVGDSGWGSLWWKKTGASTGTLVWRYRGSGAFERELDTGISVPPTATSQVVHFFVFRDRFGTWKFFDTTIAKNTFTGFQADNLPNDLSAWGFFRHTVASPTIHKHTDCAIEQFWLFETPALELKSPGGVDGAGGFITRTTGFSLHRDEALGLLRLAKFNESHWDGTNVLLQAVSGNATWARDSTLTPVLRSYTLTDASPTMGAFIDANAMSSNNERGYRVGEPSVPAKRWGGPIVMPVETVTYRV
ncbi:MAG: hypothetical protein ACE5FA_01855, partial [Dehalococcoidia bacterium]